MNRGITHSVIAGVLLTCAAIPSAHAQDPCWIQGDTSGVGHRPSPFDSASVALDGGTIKVCYGRPSRRGRTVIGELVPYEAPWRMGANEATMIHVPFAARIAGIAVAPGWYSLYAIPEAKQWRIVVNRDAQRWGVPINDLVRSKDVGSAVVPIERVDRPVETLTIALRRTSSAAASVDGGVGEHARADSCRAAVS